MAGATSPYTREAATGQILRSIESRSRIQTFAVWIYCDNWFRHRKKKSVARTFSFIDHGSGPVSQCYQMLPSLPI